MKILVCGDSFCAASRYDRDHFSQILQDDYGYEVKNIARGGMSMVGIGMQIQSAIKDKPWAIIHGRTSPHRLEIPIKDRNFNPQLGIKDFVYWHHSEASTGNDMVGDIKSAMLCDVLVNFLPDSTVKYWDDVVTSEQRNAVREYFTHLFDAKLQTEINSWIHEYWTMKIKEHGIVSIPFLSDTIGAPAYEFANQNPDFNVLYHTDRKTQEIIAKNIADILNRSVR